MPLLVRQCVVPIFSLLTVVAVLSAWEFALEPWLAEDADDLPWEKWEFVVYGTVAALVALTPILFMIQCNARRQQCAEQNAASRVARALEQTTDGYIALDHALIIGYLNASGGRYLGEESGNAVGRQFWDVFPESASLFFKPLQRARKTGEAQLTEGYYPPKDKWLEVHVFPSDQGLDVYFRDISGRKKAEQERDARIRAESESKAKSQFLATMSHEIRTPLAAVIGYADLLRNQSNCRSCAERDHIDNILSSSQYLLAIINDVLDVSKIESGHLEAERIPVVLDRLLAEIGSTSGARLREKGLDFTIHKDADLPQAIWSDPIRLRQILLNLLNNAEKFTEQGSVTLSASYSSSRAQVEFAVEDTGVGLTPEQIVRVFDPFCQADVSTTRRYGGTGLGLSICRDLAALLGGSMNATSVPGKGSRFQFTVPTGDCAAACEQTAAQIALEDEPRTFDGHVLLAEDNPQLQRLMLHLLENVGLEVSIAHNGREAVERALVEDFDLILMDVRMPEVDGLEAVSLLRGAGCLRPIVALTANSSREDERECFNAGCNAFLAKPITRQRLLLELANWLNPSDGRRTAQTAPALDEDFQTEFLVELKETIERLLAQRDSGSLRQHLHDIKGTAGSYGFPEISSLARSAEEALSAHDDNTVRYFLKQIGLRLNIRQCDIDSSVCNGCACPSPERQEIKFVKCGVK